MLSSHLLVEGLHNHHVDLKKKQINTSKNTNTKTKIIVGTDDAEDNQFHPPHAPSTLSNYDDGGNRVYYIAQKLCKMDAGTQDWLTEINRFSDELITQQLSLSGEDLKTQQQQTIMMEKSMRDEEEYAIVDKNNSNLTTDDSIIQQHQSEKKIMKNNKKSSSPQIFNPLFKNQQQHETFSAKLPTHYDFDSLELTDEFLKNCDPKSKALINAILQQKYEAEKNQNSQLNDNINNHTQNAIENKTNSNKNDVLNINENNLINKNRKINDNKSTFVLDPEGEADEPIGNIKKLVSTLIYQNHELRRNQNAALHRETMLKTELSEHHKLVEQQLNVIGEKLESLCSVKNNDIKSSTKTSNSNHGSTIIGGGTSSKKYHKNQLNEYHQQQNSHFHNRRQTKNNNQSRYGNNSPGQHQNHFSNNTQKKTRVVKRKIKKQHQQQNQNHLSTLYENSYNHPTCSSGNKKNLSSSSSHQKNIIPTVDVGELNLVSDVIFLKQKEEEEEGREQESLSVSSSSLNNYRSKARGRKLKGKSSSSSSARKENNNNVVVRQSRKYPDHKFKFQDTVLNQNNLTLRVNLCELDGFNEVKF